MKTEEITKASAESFITDRRTFLSRLGLAGLALTSVALVPGCGGGGGLGGSSNQDQSLLNAAATAEALATTMYWNMIHSPLYAALNGNAPDQAYLEAAFEQELIHYNTLVGAGAQPITTTFYFPPNMFTGSSNAVFQTAVNTLVTLEDAFIAAYLIAIRDFSTNGKKVLAGQIMGIEAEHRALARVITNDLGLTETTGLSGNQESVVAPSHTSNNIAFERTFSSALPNIAAVVTALTPFVGTSTGNVAPPISFATASSSSGTVTLDSVSP